MIRRLGEGGMAYVQLAHDEELGREVALKFPRVPEDGVDPEPGRFQEEARVCASLVHPNVVRLYDVGELEGRPFLAFEFIPGWDLESRISSHGPIELDLFLTLAPQVLDGLEHAHQAGVIHRDLKPGNILVEEETGTARIADFGVSLMDRGRSFKTQAGVLLGTPEYMAGELIRTGAYSPGTDLYALSCTFYHILTGQVPHRGKRDVDTLRWHLSPEPPTPIRQSRLEVPPGVAEWVERGIAKDPADRPASARAMRLELEAVLAGSRRSGRIVDAPTSLVRTGRSGASRASRSGSLRSASSVIRADAPTDVIRPGALTGAVPRRPTPGHLALAALVLVAVSGMGWRFLRPGPLPRRHIEGGVSFRADPDRLDRLLLRVGGIEADRITAWSIRDAGAPAGVAHDAGTPDESGGAPQGSSGLLVGGESGEPVSLPLGPGERRSGLVLDVTLEDGGRRRHALGRVEGSLWHLAREIRRDRVIDLIGRGHTLEGFKDISLTDHSDLFDDEEGFRAEVQTLVEADPHLRAVLAAGAAFRQYFASEVPVQDRWAMYEAYRPVVFIDLLLLSQRVPALFDFQGVTQGLVHRTYDRDVPPTGPAEISITGGPTCWWPRGYSDVINIASWNSLFPHTDGIMRPRDVPDSTPVRRPALSDYQWIRSYPGSIPAWPDGTRRVRVRAMVTYYGPAYFWTLRFKGPEGEPLDLRLLHSGEPAWYLAMNGQPEHRPTRGLSGVIDAVTTTREFGGRVWGDLTVTVPVEVLPAPPLDVTVRQDTLPGIALGDLGTMERLTYIRDLTVEPLRH